MYQYRENWQIQFLFSQQFHRFPYAFSKIDRFNGTSWTCANDSPDHCRKIVKNSKILLRKTVFKDLNLKFNIFDFIEIMWITKLWNTYVSEAWLGMKLGARLCFLTRNCYNFSIFLKKINKIITKVVQNCGCQHPQVQKSWKPKHPLHQGLIFCRKSIHLWWALLVCSWAEFLVVSGKILTILWNTNI